MFRLNLSSASLTRRFAIAAALLSAAAVILIALTSIWLVNRQQEKANDLLQQREVAFHAEAVANNLQALGQRFSEMADSPILANGLVDSAGKDTYLTPFLHGLARVNGIPVGILFTDFQGKEIAGNGVGTFNYDELAWLRQQIQSGHETSTIREGPDGAHLLGIELVRYSRTSTPEGGLMYKVRLTDLVPAPSARLAWSTDDAKPASYRVNSEQVVSVGINSLPHFKHLPLRLEEDRRKLPEILDAQTSQYALILGIASMLAAVVFIVGSRLAHSLTLDLRRLEVFSSTLGNEGISNQRAALAGSAEVTSLARSINRMLDRLYRQHTELQHESIKFEKAEMAVRQSEARLQQGLIAARMAVWDWDVTNGMTSFSANLQSLFGESWQSMHRFWEMVDPEDVPLLRQAVDDAIRQCGEYLQVVRMHRPDNAAIVWVEMRGKVAADAGAAPSVIHVVAIDVTERRRAEEGLRAADRRKDEFLAMLAHELRNPLAPISSAAELLKLIQSSDPKVKQTGEVIGRQVKHMTRLVDDLLDVSRVTRGLVTLTRARLDLRCIVNEAVEQTRPLVEAKRHRLITDLPAQPVWVNGDQTRLVQVVTNLVNNSAKYTAEGGAIQLLLWLDKEQAVLQVRDNGSGIDPALLPDVFELFTQGVRTLDRSQGGLGLGLALVKKLVELHHGGVTACSKGVGHGSEFTFWLPLAREAGTLDTPPSVAAAPAPGYAGIPLRIMVVDDNVDAANSLAMLLQVEGHSVSVEYTAHGALCRANAKSFDILILDIGLPDMNGYELARKLKMIPTAVHSTLIAVTGYGQNEDRVKSFEAGFAQHIVKPVSGAELSALLTTYTNASFKIV